MDMIPSNKSAIGYNITDLYREAQYRWLKPAEVFYILQNIEDDQLSNEAPHLPPSGSLFLFNKRVTRYFRRDGHNWRKKKQQCTVSEAHEKLKVGNVEALNCYYAHGEDTPSFQRRSYWMLDPGLDHIVLVHYRDIKEQKSIPGPVAPSPMLNPSASTTLYSTPNMASTSRMPAVNGSYQNIVSPGSVEVSSEVFYSSNASDHFQGVHGEEPFSFQEGLQQIRAQLSLDDDFFKANDLFTGEDDLSNSAGYSAFEAVMAKQPQLFPEDSVDSATYQTPPENSGKQDNFINHVVFQGIDDNGATVGEEDSLLKELLEPWVKPLSSSSESNPRGKQGHESSETTNHQFAPKVEHFKIPAYPSEAEIEADAEYYQLFDQFMLPEAPNLTVSEAQRYTIHCISPEWAYSSEATKVIIVGSFLCNSSVTSWMCMFGEVEVPVEMIKDGVFRCEAPACSPGRVTLCITTGNREACSEVREFEYRAKSIDVCAQCQSASSEASWSTKELQILVRTVRMLLCSLPKPQEDSETSQSHQPKYSTVDSDLLNNTLKALKDGTADSSKTTSLLLNELLKDKLHQWLSVRTKEAGGQNGCSLSKEEQGIIHLVAALGFEWALKPILNCGVNVNFRDFYGQTPLHWAALFGREKMVAALIACGAYAGAVTDPSKKDPTGKTAASIAASNGFKGLAGYLSEVALTTHLSSLTLQECELSRGSAELEAERTISSVSEERSFSSYEDQLSLNDSLAAVRTAALAAARIQAAFRVHSFRKRRQREGAFDDDYGISASDIHALSTIASSSRDCNLAAMSIQKKYRGWKGRKDFLAIRQKVIKIQAHVRGYQVRKNYRVFCWAVGVLDRVILRWRRKGVGLRNFLNERELKEDNSDNEEEDILKLFRKQNMDRALNEAVSRVLSVVESPDARQQYRRLLESYRKAKAEGAPPSTSGDSMNMVT